MAPKQFHVIRHIVGEQTEQEAMEAYCQAKSLDPERFMNEEYGTTLIILRNFKSPGDIYGD